MNKNLRTAIASLALGLPALAFAQAPDRAASTYISLEAGTGKVSVRCGAGEGCSPVDTSGVIRFGHRFDPSWAFEAAYTHIDADWGFFGYDRSAALSSFALGAAYSVPLTGSVDAVLRFGGAAHELELQRASAPFGANPGTTTTRSVKPYVGVALRWQFARHWSASLNADFTRGSLRDAADAPKQSASVRTLGLGIAFNF
jgi:hypothetical protein